MSLLSDIVSCYRSDVMPLFYTDHESQNHQESINVWIRLDSWRIVNFSTHSLMFYDSSTKKGKKQLRIFAGFGWIRSESPRNCAKFTAMCNNILDKLVKNKLNAAQIGQELTEICDDSRDFLSP